MPPQLDLNNIFTYHKPFGNQPERYQRLRDKAKELGQMIQNDCPDSRERAVALTNLQQTIMWAYAAIAINEVESK